MRKQNKLRQIERVQFHFPLMLKLVLFIQICSLSSSWGGIVKDLQKTPLTHMEVADLIKIKKALGEEWLARQKVMRLDLEREVEEYQHLKLKNLDLQSELSRFIQGNELKKALEEYSVARGLFEELSPQEKKSPLQVQLVQSKKLQAQKLMEQHEILRSNFKVLVEQLQQEVESKRQQLFKVQEVFNEKLRSKQLKFELWETKIQEAIALVQKNISYQWETGGPHCVEINKIKESERWVDGAICEQKVGVKYQWVLQEQQLACAKTTSYDFVLDNTIAKIRCQRESQVVYAWAKSGEGTTGTKISYSCREFAWDHIKKKGEGDHQRILLDEIGGKSKEVPASYCERRYHNYYVFQNKQCWKKAQADTQLYISQVMDLEKVPEELCLQQLQDSTFMCAQEYMRKNPWDVFFPGFLKSSKKVILQTADVEKESALKKLVAAVDPLLVQLYQAAVEGRPWQQTLAEKNNKEIRRQMTKIFKRLDKFKKSDEDSDKDSDEDKVEKTPAILNKIIKTQKRAISLQWEKEDLLQELLSLFKVVDAGSRPKEIVLKEDVLDPYLQALVQINSHIAKKQWKSAEVQSIKNINAVKMKNLLKIKYAQLAVDLVKKSRREKWWRSDLTEEQYQQLTKLTLQSLTAAEQFQQAHGPEFNNVSLAAYGKNYWFYLNGMKWRKVNKKMRKELGL